MPDTLEHFYLQHDEPVRSTLLALRDIILKRDNEITEAFKYYMPCFCYRGKMFCFLWVNKKTRLPYIEFVEGKYLTHPALIAEKRSRMKILVIDPRRDLPVRIITSVIKQALELCSIGIVKK